MASVAKTYRKKLGTRPSLAFAGAVAALMTPGCDGLVEADPAASASMPAPGRTPNSTSRAAAWFSRGEQSVVTGWESQPNRLSSTYCKECHTLAHRQWRQSGHAAAWKGEHFQRAYAHEPRRWCRNCHAPLLAQEQGLVSRDDGIACAACHVREGRIVGTREVASSVGGHVVVALEGFDSPTLCAGCHEFPFPKQLTESGTRAVIYTEYLMQATDSEWRTAGSAPCAHCHDGGHAHRGPRDHAWLRAQFGRGIGRRRARLPHRPRVATPQSGSRALQPRLRASTPGPNERGVD